MHTYIMQFVYNATFVYIYRSKLNYTTYHNRVYCPGISVLYAWLILPDRRPRAIGEISFAADVL